MKRFLIPGLAVYFLLSGLGLFLQSGISNPLLLPFGAGFLILLFTASYYSLFSRERIPGAVFIGFGIIGLNLLIQATGGGASPFRPAYFLLAVAASFQPPLYAYAAVGIIILIDAGNLFFSGQADPAGWGAYAGFALSLIGIIIITTPVTGRILNQARVSRERYRRLLADAHAVDPLVRVTNVDALSVSSRRAANVSRVVEREGVFKGLIDMIYGMVPAHTYALFLAEPFSGSGAAEEEFVLRAIRSESRHIAPAGAIKILRGSGLIGICIDKNQPQHLPNVVIPAKSLGYYTHELPIKSFYAVPITVGDRCAGVLVVDSLEKNDFSPETQDLLVRFSPFFGQIIEKIRISQELDVRATNASALHEMSAILNSSLELSEVLNQLTGRMKIVVPNDFCAFILYQEESAEMMIAAQDGFSSRFVGSRFRLEDSAILNQMFRQWKDRSVTEPYDFPDLGKRGRDIELFPLKELQLPFQCVYCLPLVAREKFIGACIIGSVKSNAFTRHHKDFMGTLMNQVAVVIDNTTLHQRIRDMAHTDGLTGLLNHRTFMEKLDDEFKRLDRDYRPFSLLLMDIDLFKKVNDTHGHPVGDVALKRIADIIRETARSVDYVARYGGEEFAVGMVGADTKGARQMAERIRKTVEQETILAGKIELRLTLSIGLASHLKGRERKEDLIIEADQALYDAKHAGRNRVCLYGEHGTA